MMEKIKLWKPYICMGLKYAFPLFLIGITFSNHGNIYFFLTELMELGVVFALSDILMKKHKIGQIVNNILLLFFNAQMVVMFFAYTYISMIMLSNLHSIEDLMGKAVVYGAGVLFVLLFSFLPIKKVWKKEMVSPILFLVFLVLELAVTMNSSFLCSPFYSYVDIAKQYKQVAELNKMLENMEGVDPLTFYSDGITDYRQKDQNLSEKPNVILIFTEGLSQNIISDEQEIVPNMAEYQKKSVSFDNYYNHTAATYRGLTGQLYSGYQLNDFDTNGLVSIQSIFSDLGYHTSFFNVEPHNVEFTSYLENLGFDEVRIDDTYECNGMVNTVSDKDAYQILFDAAEEQAQTGEPFFMTIYTFGTHTSLDSTDMQYGDGSNELLNKFYDADYQFGRFMDKLENSTLADNTIVIMTTDHATYQDDSFMNTFTGYYRYAGFCDEIPFFIYYKGVEAEVIDVNGRNTLNMVPTVLDFLDISAPNHFLGTSLFASEASSVLETSFTDSYVFMDTEDSQITTKSGEDYWDFMLELQEYYYIKMLE